MISTPDRDTRPVDAPLHARLRAWYSANSRGLYLFGPPGAGKTRLARALLQDFQRDGRAGHFAHLQRDVFDSLKAAFGRKNGRDPGEIQQHLEQVPVLVLDGLGDHQDTPWTWLVLYDILDARLCANLVTILTSRELPGAWAGRFKNRIYSRLREYVVPVLVGEGPPGIMKACRPDFQYLTHGIHKNSGQYRIQ